MKREDLLELIENGENSGVEFKRDDIRPEQLAPARPGSSGQGAAGSETIQGTNGQPLPPDAEIYFRHVEDTVRVGSRVELDPGEARLLNGEGEK